jgi:hypothetical protein
MSDIYFFESLVDEKNADNYDGDFAEVFSEYVDSLQEAIDGGRFNKGAGYEILEDEGTPYTIRYSGDFDTLVELCVFESEFFDGPSQSINMEEIREIVEEGMFE